MSPLSLEVVMIPSDAYVSEQTVIELLTDLSARGWADSFGVAAGGAIRCPEGELVPVTRLRVDALYRFEGAADPSEETLVVAATVETTDGRRRGSLVLAYGPAMTPDELAVVEALEDHAAVR